MLKQHFLKGINTVKNRQLILFAIFVATIIFLNNATFAELEPPCITIDEGYYLGISAGYDTFSVTDKLDFRPFAYYDPTVTVDGVTGGVFIGYRRLFDPSHKIYLGGEFFIKGSSADSDYRITINSNNTLTTDVNMISNYGLSLMPSIQINPKSLLYLRLGYNWLKIETNQINTNSNFPPMQFNDFDTLHGFNYGIGLETIFLDRVDLRFEYQFTQYNSMETPIAKISPFNQQWLVGLLYRFYL
jgi:opacity protein-like surface antigen